MQSKTNGAHRDHRAACENAYWRSGHTEQSHQLDPKNSTSGHFGNQFNYRSFVCIHHRLIMDNRTGHTAEYHNFKPIGTNHQKS